MKPTPIERDNLVKALIAARVRAEVTQKEIAKRAHCSRDYIAQVEGGYCWPTARHLHAYADLCDMDADALCRAWNCIPDDVRKRLLDRPELWALVRMA